MVSGMDSLSPSEVLQHLLGEHDIVNTHWAVHHPQLRLPENVVAACESGSVMLALGYNMPVPILGWGFLEQALECTCSFDRVLYNCVLPWDALIQASPANESVMCVWPQTLLNMTLDQGKRTVTKLDKLLADTADTKPRHLKAVK